EYQWFGEHLALPTPTNAPVVNIPDQGQMTPNRQGMLSLDGIRFRYRGSSKDVIINASFNLEPGRVYVLEGLNGSGKSTLSKLLAGVLQPTHGEIRFAGRPSSPWKTPGRIVGYHFQNPDLQIFSTTVEEEIGMSVSNNDHAGKTQVVETL